MLERLLAEQSESAEEEGGADGESRQRWIHRQV